MFVPFVPGLGREPTWDGGGQYPSEIRDPEIVVVLLTPSLAILGSARRDPEMGCESSSSAGGPTENKFGENLIN